VLLWEGRKVSEGVESKIRRKNGGAKLKKRGAKEKKGGESLSEREGGKPMNQDEETREMMKDHNEKRGIARILCRKKAIWFKSGPPPGGDKRATHVRRKLKRGAKRHLKKH